MQYFKLNSGGEMPALGLGVFQIPDRETCRRAVLQALETGYRHIDTAAAYMNERAVGEAIKESGIPRRELFITTKLWVQDMSYNGAREAMARSMENLGLDYLDLYLIHQPMGDYHGAYRAMEEACREGTLRAIGVSNFYPHILADLCETADITPAVNQVELHPFFAQTSALENMRRYGVLPEAWAPFAEGKFDLFNNPVLTGIGAKYGKTAAQTALKWNIARGVAVIPKSVRAERIRENFDIFDFELTPEDMAEITALSREKSAIVDHTDPDFVRRMHRQKVHD